ncbi:MAG: hypothetical protein ACRC28_18620 [Clostridium sp.]|uniref:hypothetical protein n=1 Tax=Clostridium sp. TaxID=1506 RepID=UPI003F3E7A68
MNNYKISKHMIERYLSRMEGKRDESKVIKNIRSDLNVKKIKHMYTLERDGETIIHVFTSNSKEFRFVRKEDCDILMTMIRYTKPRYLKRIDKIRALKGLPPLEIPYLETL